MTTTAQDVRLSEIHADTGNGWVELHNTGSSAVNISTWSLHYATLTPGAAQNYWWPFPSGTILPANSFLRVNWLSDEPTVPPPAELFTGTTPYTFLFGLGAEPVRAHGAFALFNTQDNLLMNSVSSVVDWVSYGSNGFQRELLAETAGLWDSTRHAPMIDVTTSLARDPDLIGTTTHADEEWFLDYSPTPLLPNVTGAIAQPYGSACTLPGNHLLGLPQLSATSLPLIGNAQFGLTIGNTTGIYGEYVLIGFSTGAAPSGLPSILPAYAGNGCNEVIDTTQLVGTWLLPTTILQTNLPLPLDTANNSMIGSELHAQALIIELLPTTYPPYQGLTNALRIVLGK